MAVSEKADMNTHEEPMPIGEAALYYLKRCEALEAKIVALEKAGIIWP